MKCVAQLGLLAQPFLKITVGAAASNNGKTVFGQALTNDCPYPSHTTSYVSYFAAHIHLLKGVTKLDPFAGPGNEKPGIGIKEAGRLPCSRNLKN
jgi:hypothetical protein